MDKIRFAPPQVMLNRDEVDELLEDLVHFRHDPRVLTGISVKPGNPGRIQLRVDWMLTDEQGEIVAVLGGSTFDREVSKWTWVDKSEPPET